MSKKSRLKKQKEKQVQMKKLADLEELEEKEAAKHRESKGAKKLRRRAKRSLSDSWLIIPKLIMLAAFLWSGFFYGGVLSAAVLGDGIYISANEFMPHWVAYFTLAGEAAALAGILLAFFKIYPAAFAAAAVGNVLYMRAVRFVMKNLRHFLDTQWVDEEQKNMYREYMIRYYPFMITFLMAALLFGVWIFRTISRKRREKSERDNAPVESIVS